MKSENSKNVEAARRRRFKLINWGVCAQKIEKHFDSVRREALSSNYFESLNVFRADKERTVQLHAGSHPIGSVHIVRDNNGLETGRKLDVEHGAALVVSQSSVGKVALVLYPYDSEKFKQRTEYIIWRVLDDPAKVTKSLLRRATKDFFRYIRVSSSLFNETWWDRFRVCYLEFRGRKYTADGGLARLVFSNSFRVIGALGSLASIYAICN